MKFHNTVPKFIRIEHILDDDEYYYVSIDQFIKSKDIFIPKNIVDSKIKICIDSSYEAYKNTIDLIYKLFVNDLSIDPARIILLSGSPDISDHISNTIKVLYHSRLEYDISWQTKKHIKKLNHGFKKNREDYLKSFLCFNRRWRLHRPALVGLLFSCNLIHKGFVSLTKSDDTKSWSQVYELIKELNKDTNFLELWDQNRQLILNIPDLFLDHKTLVQNRADLELNTQKFYSNTYYSVITETNYYKDIAPARFITEKTFKSMAFKHPFILVSRPGSMQVLKNMGYKTFHPYIDERYDHEQDDSKRMILIIEEIKRLSNISNQEFIHFKEGVQNVLDHNFSVLLSKSDKVLL